MSFPQVARRPACDIVGMRVVKADYVFAARIGLALNAHQFSRIDLIPTARRIVVRVAALHHGQYLPGAVRQHLAGKHPAALVRIGRLAVAANLFELRCCKFQGHTAGAACSSVNGGRRSIALDLSLSIR